MTRAVHRRADSPADGLHESGRPKKLEDQLEIDRGYMASTAGLLYEACDKVSSHELSIATWRRWNDSTARSIDENHADFLMRIESLKTESSRKADDYTDAQIVNFKYEVAEEMRKAKQKS